MEISILFVPVWKSFESTILLTGAVFSFHSHSHFPFRLVVLLWWCWCFPSVNITLLSYLPSYLAPRACPSKHICHRKKIFSHISIENIPQYLSFRLLIYLEKWKSKWHKLIRDPFNIIFLTSYGDDVMMCVRVSDLNICISFPVFSSIKLKRKYV